MACHSATKPGRIALRPRRVSTTPCIVVRTPFQCMISPPLHVQNSSGRPCDDQVVSPVFLSQQIKAQEARDAAREPCTPTSIPWYVLLMHHQFDLRVHILCDDLNRCVLRLTSVIIDYFGVFFSCVCPVFCRAMVRGDAAVGALGVKNRSWRRCRTDKVM